MNSNSRQMMLHTSFIDGCTANGHDPDRESRGIDEVRSAQWTTTDVDVYVLLIELLKMSDIRECLQMTSNKRGSANVDKG